MCFIIYLYIVPSSGCLPFFACFPNLAAQVQELFYWHSFPRFARHVDDHQDVEVLKWFKCVLMQARQDEPWMNLLYVCLASATHEVINFFATLGNWQLLANLSTFRGSDSLSMRRDCNQGSGDSRKISSSCWKSAALVFPPFKLKHHHYIIYLWAADWQIVLSAYANSDGSLFVDLLRTKDIPKTLSFCIVRGVKCLKPLLQMLRSREHSCHSFYWHTISFFTNMHFHSFPALSASAYIYIYIRSLLSDYLVSYKVQTWWTLTWMSSIQDSAHTYRMSRLGSI